MAAPVHTIRTAWRDSVSVREPILDVETMFGAKGDGVTVDVAPILQAIEVAKQIGGARITFRPGARYNFGSFGTGSFFPIHVTDLKHVTFDFNGAEWFGTLTDVDAGLVFITLRDPINIVFNQPRLIVDGASDPPDFAGPRGIVLEVSGTSGPDVGHVTFNDPYFEGLTSSLLVWRVNESATRRMRHIRLYNGFIKNGYYGPNFQQAGDDFVGDWACYNIRRAYFPYGVRSHRARVSVFNDTDMGGANACILIATHATTDGDPAPIPTQDIHVDASFTGELGTHWGSLVAFTQVSAVDDQPQTIKNCSAKITLTDVTGLSATQPFLFSSHEPQLEGGAEETGTTVNIWSGIHLDAVGMEAVSAVTSFGLVSLRVSPTVPADIHFGPGMTQAFGRRWDFTDSSLDGAKLDNWLFYHHPRAFIKAKRGDLTAAPMVIDLTELDSNRFAMKIRVYAAASVAVFSGQSVTFKEFIVVGFNGGGGAVGISSQTSSEHSTGTASAITLAASSETLTLSFTNYNTANARAIVECELIWPYGAKLG